MRKYFWLILVVFVLVVGAYFLMNNKKTATVTIDNQKFNVEIAKTNAERAKGLMNRKSLDENSGMLFVFPSFDIQPFWMKNTLIPLDIIYIDNPSTALRAGKIVEITTLNSPIDSNIPQYTPKNKANYVLELPAGTAKKYNFKLGNPVEIKY